MNGPRIRRSLLAGLMVVTFALTISAGVALRPTETAFGATSTLLILSGPVGVREAGGALFPASDGATLAAGSTIVTGAGARAVITYFEGSTVTVEPESELTIDALGTDGASSVITMTQQLGRTWHVVTRLIGAGSRYEVRTPAATAAVRGTAFQVAVSADGATTVTTTEGAVATAAADGTGEVLVGPGATTTVPLGAPPQPPRPAPRAEMQTTVEVGAASGLIVDPLGRTNGIVDGRTVLQTPGATASLVDGKLVVTLPDLPDGPVATVVQSDDPVAVVVGVQQRERPAVVVREVTSGRPVAVEIVADPAGALGARTLPRSDPRPVPTPRLAAPSVAEARRYIPQLGLPALPGQHAAGPSDAARPERPTTVDPVAVPLPAAAPARSHPVLEAGPALPVASSAPAAAAEHRAAAAVRAAVPAATRSNPDPRAIETPVPAIETPVPAIATPVPTVAPTPLPTLAPTPPPSLAPAPVPTVAPRLAPARTPAPRTLPALPGL